jgi:hypothetical protein
MERHVTKSQIGALFALGEENLKRISHSFHNQAFVDSILVEIMLGIENSRKFNVSGVAN